MSGTGVVGNWILLLGLGFTLFGTFLTRSGILSSVHAFAGSPGIGTSFLAFIALVLLISFGLPTNRPPAKQARGREMRIATYGSSS